MMTISRNSSSRKNSRWLGMHLALIFDRCLAHRLNYKVNLSLCHSVAENVEVATKINKRLFLLFVEDACTSKILENDFSMHWEEFVYNYQEQEPQ